MKSIDLLDDYELFILSASPEGFNGKVWHVFPHVHAAGKRHTPVGYFMGSVGELSELRPFHWDIRLFFRGDIRYHRYDKITEVVGHSDSASNPQRYAEELPTALVQTLIDCKICEEPVAVTICEYREVGFIEFGETWVDD